MESKLKGRQSSLNIDGPMYRPSDKVINSKRNNVANDKMLQLLGGTPPLKLGLYCFLVNLVGVMDHFRN